MKKHNNSGKKGESKRTKSPGPVRRNTREVLAEPLAKLKGKAGFERDGSNVRRRGSARRAWPQSRPSDGGSGSGGPMEPHCILGLEGETLMLRARDTLVAARTELINATRGLVKSMGTRPPKCSSPSFAQKVEEAVPAEILEAPMRASSACKEARDEIPDR